MKRKWIIAALIMFRWGAVSGAPAPDPAEEERLPAARLTIEEADRLLTTARAAYEDGLYRLARRRLEELVAGAPDKRRQSDAALWLARVLLAEQRPEAALEVMHAHEGKVRTAARQAEWAWTRAQALRDAGRLAEAAAELEPFRGAFAQQESAPAALRLLAQIYAAQTNWAAAEGICRELEQRGPDSSAAAAAWLDLAQSLVENQQLPRARAVLQAVTTNYSGTVWAEQAILKQAELQLAQGERTEALQRLQALANSPHLLAETRAQGYRIVARALARESNFPAALRMINRSLAAATDPAQRLESEIFKARLLLQSGGVEEGAALMRAAAARIPDEVRRARLQRELADELFLRQRWEPAVREYQVWRDAFEGLPETAEVLTGQAGALWELGRYEEAATAYARAAAAQSDPVRRLALRQKQADALFAGRRYAEAKAEYQAVLADAPPDSDGAGRARLQLAECELALGQIESGEVHLLELSRQKKETEFTRAATLRLGALYEERGALETAVEQYSRLIRTSADSGTLARALLNRGLIRYRMGAFQAALEDFTRLRDEFPQEPPAAQARFMRAWCLYLLGKDAEALQAAEQILATDPASTYAQDIRFWLGEYAFNHGDYEQAEQRLASLAADHPESPRAADALFWAGQAAAARRAYLAANEHYNTLMARYPEYPRLAETLLAQGNVLSELGQFAAAILAFNEVIVKFPHSPEALMAWGREGDCQFTLGAENPSRYEEALISYRTVLEAPAAPPDLRLQAGFKLGRCFEKLGRATAALERYMEVVYSYLQESPPPEMGQVWFTRAAFAAAALQEAAGNWNEAAGIYRRVVDSGLPAAAEARARLERIQREHWTAL